MNERKKQVTYSITVVSGGIVSKHVAQAVLIYTPKHCSCITLCKYCSLFFDIEENFILESISSS